MGCRLPDNIKLFLYRVSLHSGRVVETQSLWRPWKAGNIVKRRRIPAFLGSLHFKNQVQAAFFAGRNYRPSPPTERTFCRATGKTA